MAEPYMKQADYELAKLREQLSGWKVTTWLLLGLWVLTLSCLLFMGYLLSNTINECQSAALKLHDQVTACQADNAALVARIQQLNQQPQYASLVQFLLSALK